MKKNIYVCSNKREVSIKTAMELRVKLEKAGFNVQENLDEKTALIISVGGDGATLNAIHDNNFPQVPIVGVNTGTLGFFQEIHPDQLDEFIDHYINDKYVLQPMSTVKATIKTTNATHIRRGLNEVVITGGRPKAVHIDINIDNNFIEKYSGDGIIISTPAGSTAYNYSIGGAIVDPRLKLLQITPIAPFNTTAYRSFTSSLLLPPDLPIQIIPEEGRNSIISVISDGIDQDYDDVEEIKIEFANEVVNLLRFESYEFWNKVKSKFL